MADQDDDYFNDLSRQSMSQDTTQSGNTGGNTSPNEDDGNSVPRQKRMACIICRKRKLRCDGKKPSCGTCARVGHNCTYDEVRKKSGPKRGYVKQLEARLAQVEILLKNQEPENTWNEPNRSSLPNTSMPSAAPDNLAAVPDLSTFVSQSAPQLSGNLGQSQGSQNGASAPPTSINTESSWEVISLGLEEPLPTQSVMDELFDIFFTKVHPSTPMIHRPRFLAAMDLAPQMRPPVCLRYIIWTLAASVTPKYRFLEEHFYSRARKYMHLDEMKGHGEHMVSVNHCQAWVLIALYEFKQMYFPRAWVSVGRAARMAAMMCFNRLDGAGLDVKHCIPPPRDWTEREERRRTFWMCFSQDRYASIGTGWPMVFDERDIMTNLPASEESFLSGTPENTPSLKDVLAGDIANLSPLGNVVVMACIFGLNLTHLHRPDPQDREGDVNGEFWKRHRAYDNILLNVSLSLPHSLRLPQGIADPNIIFSNMAIHTSTICLHQAAIFKAEKNKSLNQIAAESKRRCIIAADQVASIMKMVSHTDLSLLNPFSAFCLYVAARVFVQYLKSRPEDQAVKSSLQFLLTALGALKQFSALTESFLIQLDVDLSGTSFGASMRTMRAKHAAAEFEADNCVPLVNIRTVQEEVSTDLNTGSPESRGTSSLSPPHNFGFLPNRFKQNKNAARTDRPPLGNANRNHGSLSTDAASDPGPTQDDNVMLSNFDMDVSPNLGSGDNMNSENASPQTMNSSSNPAYTPPSMDHNPMMGSQSHNRNVTDANKNDKNPNLINFSTNINDLSANDMSFSQFLDTTSMNLSMDSVGMENSVHMGGNWGSMAQPSGGFGGSNNHSFDMMGGGDSGMANFSERQFEMLLQNMGWNGWPQS